MLGETVLVDFSGHVGEYCTIPGYGTWREWWVAEHPGEDFPQEVPLPRGWSERTLYRMLPSERALKAARQGFLASLPMGVSTPID